MHDILDIIKNVQTLTSNDSAFTILKDFERVLDELDIYVFKNWDEGELLAGPDTTRYAVTCKFLWTRDNMPDPEGGARLLDYGCKVTYEKSNVLVPRKIYTPDDLRPGTKKGKIDAHPVWIVSITMPKKLMQDMYQGYTDQDHRQLADLMKMEEMQGEAQQDTAPMEEVPSTGVSATAGGPEDAAMQAAPAQ